MSTALDRGGRLHDLSYPSGEWTCPKTGYVVPKRLEENIHARLKLRTKAAGSGTLRRELIKVCSQSVLLWTNLFVDTFKPLQVSRESNQLRGSKVRVIPFITWPVQDLVVGQIDQIIEDGGDAATDKSRSMGASWINLLPMAHRWLFRREQLFKLISRKEEEVDDPGDPDSLFWKLDFILERIPEWMRPKIERSHMHLENLTGRSVFDGESTNSHAGRGGRRDAMLFDEAGAIPNLARILESSHMAAGARLFVSTPVGPGTYSDLVMGGKVKVFILGWWDHPEFGRGRKFRTIRKGNTEIRELSSPWRDLEVSNKSRREVATNIDIDHMAAGATFFDHEILQSQRAQFVTNPQSTGTLSFIKDSPAWIDAQLSRGKIPVRLIPGSGRWKFWIPLIDGRPDQRRQYAMGADICHGLGDTALSSNSVLFVVDVDTGEQVAEYADPSLEPGQFTRLACAAGHWFGGVHGCAFFAWEANGPGLTVAKHVKRLAYPWVYLRIDTQKKSDETTAEMGWHSNPGTKLEYYGECRGDMASGRLCIRSEDVIRELSSIVFLGGEEIGPAAMQSEAEDAKATHGDRVTAAVIANHARKIAPRIKVKAVKSPPGSVAEAFEEIEKDEKRRKDEEWD